MMFGTSLKIIIITIMTGVYDINIITIMKDW